ncbi:MAG TPA: ABC transporter substrate-binding protein [Thermoanaerobaculia bacterium]|nr:ABC transporter substrate-binding protein [Thermoanaerobaculia bacterium]
MSSTAVATALSKVVRIGVLSAIGKLDPRDAIDDISGLILGQVFETPYTLAAGEGQVRPGLFQLLRAEGRLQYSAAIREGATFSDGTPLTADLAARSLRGSKALHSKATVDTRDNRVWFTFTVPNPRFDLTLTQDNCAIVLDRGTQLLGTGPFTFDQRPNLRLLQTAKSIRLVRNPHHTGKNAIDELEFRILPAAEDGTPRLLVEALRRGEVDLTNAFSMADISAHQLTGVAPSLQPGNSTGILFFNTERRSVARSDVRRAIALSLDLHDLAAKSFDKNPAAFIAPSLLPPMMGRAAGLPQMDREEAKRLLDVSGARPGRLSLLVPWAPRPYMPKPLPLAQAIQKQLALTGVAVELRETRTSEEFFGDLGRGNFDLALAGWIADTPDPADFFEALLWSKSCEGENDANSSRWKHPATDAALARFRENPTEENKRAIHQLVREEAPLVPLIYGQSVVVHSRRMRNVAVSATGVLSLAGVTLTA